MFKTPKHGTVVAYAALIVALSSGGAAYAASQIGAKDIKPDAVRSKHIKDGHVRTNDLALDAVTGAHVANDSLSGDDVANDSLSGDDISEGTLGTVPNASALAGRGPATFASSTVYKTEAATDAGTRLGDNTNTKAMACNPGDILLAGGPASVAATSDLLESFPTPGTTNSWSARIIDNGVADSFTVVILCLDQTP